jgi:hypothetical protein
VTGIQRLAIRLLNERSGSMLRRLIEIAGLKGSSSTVTDFSFDRKDIPRRCANTVSQIMFQGKEYVTFGVLGLLGVL